MNTEETGLVECESNQAPQATAIEIIPDETIAAINNRHDVAIGAAKHALKAAMQCGELLASARVKVPHGHWEYWLAKYCPNIKPRTDRQYRQLFEHRVLIEGESDPIQTIGEAIKCIAESAKRHDHAEITPKVIEVLPSNLSTSNVQKPEAYDSISDINLKTSRAKPGIKLCSVCGGSEWFLTDAGYVCNGCETHEDGFPMALRDGTEEVESVQQSEMDFKIKNHRAAVTAYGKLVRAIGCLESAMRFEELLHRMQNGLMEVDPRRRVKRNG